MSISVPQTTADQKMVNNVEDVSPYNIPIAFFHEPVISEMHYFKHFHFIVIITAEHFLTYTTQSSDTVIKKLTPIHLSNVKLCSETSYWPEDQDQMMSNDGHFSLVKICRKLLSHADCCLKLSSPIVTM